jgi:phosphonate transport system permease protein
MSTSVPRLPDAQLEPLTRAYAQSLAAKRRWLWLGLAIFVACFVLASLSAEVRVQVFIDNFWRFPDYISRIFHFDTGANTGRIVFSDPVDWMWGFGKWTTQLFETILIAYIGTVVGAIFGFLLCFLAAENLSMNGWIRNTAKRFLEFCRTVPEIVFALIFVVAFGLGPVPGVLAIALHTIGALGKQFSEVVENADMRPFEGVTASGATWAESVRFAIVPQVLANFASYALLRFEVNVRGASVMGFVGAGGIGQDLVEAIRKFYYADVSAILVLIIVTVMVIDLLTERLRHHLVGMEQRS